MKLALVNALIVIGLLLLVLGTSWSSLFPPTAAWTEEKARRSAEVKTRLSNIGPIVTGATRSMHHGPDPATLKAEFDALQKENEQLDAEFQSAVDRPNTTAKLLKWSGVSLAVVGVIGWYAVKQTE